jgi:hypothetical protein
MQPTIENGKVVTRREVPLADYVAQRRADLDVRARHMATIQAEMDRILSELQSLAEPAVNP